MHVLVLKMLNGSYLWHAYRYITKYIGVGGRLEASLDDAEQAKDVLEHMFLVQEYLDGGNLRKQVLEQVLSSSGQLLARPSCCEWPETNAGPVTEHILSRLSVCR